MITGKTVQYPFGYGLSLTTFDWKDYTATWSGDTCTVSVTVTNTGDVAGKEVVQVYAQSPYTEYDKGKRCGKKPRSSWLAMPRPRFWNRAQAKP